MKRSLPAGHPRDGHPSSQLLDPKKKLFGSEKIVLVSGSALIFFFRHQERNY